MCQRQYRTGGLFEMYCVPVQIRSSLQGSQTILTVARTSTVRKAYKQNVLCKVPTYICLSRRLTKASDILDCYQCKPNYNYATRSNCLLITCFLSYPVTFLEALCSKSFLCNCMRSAMVKCVHPLKSRSTKAGDFKTNSCTPDKVIQSLLLKNRVVK